MYDGVVLGAAPMAFDLPPLQQRVKDLVDLTEVWGLAQEQCGSPRLLLHKAGAVKVTGNNPVGQLFSLVGVRISSMWGAET